TPDISAPSYDAAGAERGDVAGRVAERGEDRVGVLAETRRRRAEGGRRLLELHGVSERQASVLLDHHPAVADLGVVEHLAEMRDRPEADVEVGQVAHPFRHRPLAERRADSAEERVALLALRELLPGELGELEPLAERAPEVGLERTDGHVS